MRDEAQIRPYLDPRVLSRMGSLELRARMIVEGAMSGTHRSPQQGVSVEFAQHRQYTAGDDIRHVDWKVFARSDKLQVKQYVQETNLQMVTLVDVSESMEYDSGASGTHWSKFDHAVTAAAALCYLALRQQDAAGAAVFDSALRRFIPPRIQPPSSSA